MVVQSHIRVFKICPNGGIGIRVRLKIEWRNPYGFKSHFGHQKVVTPTAPKKILDTIGDNGQEIRECFGAADFLLFVKHLHIFSRFGKHLEI